MTSPARPTVVLVHGLWFGAWSLAVMARRLRRAGFEPLRFHYPSTRGGLQHHARGLRLFVAQFPRETLHFVAHSMGGLVVLKMLADAERLPGGRVVLLGSPLGGSEVARRSERIPGGGQLLGTALTTLKRGFDAIGSGCDVGMIAGTREIGLGMLVGGAGAPGDGTVALAETLAEGLTDRLELPVTHTGLVVSRAVARQAVVFLQSGRFDPSPGRRTPC